MSDRLQRVQAQVFDHVHGVAYSAGQGECVKCRKRPGTISWGDALALTHGGGVKRCERCAYGSQIRHALGRVVALPRLFARYLWSFRPSSSGPLGEKGEPR